MPPIRVLIALALILLASAPMGARAGTEDMVAAVLADLVGAGYEDITVERTLLNRERIVATRGDVWREIVVDPRTGEILRDLRRVVPALMQNRDSRDIIAREPDPTPGEKPDQPEPGEEEGAEDRREAPEEPGETGE